MCQNLDFVVGPALLTFDEHIEPADRESVLSAIRFATQAATELYLYGEEQWFHYMRRQMRFFGWDAKPASYAYKPSNTREALIDTALAMVREQGDAHALLARRAADRLAGHPKGLELIRYSQVGFRDRHFNIMTCVQRQAISGARLLDLVVYNATFDQTQGWSLDLRSPVVPVRVLVELIRFDVRSFQRTHGPKIEARLDKKFDDHLALLSPLDDRST